MSDEWIMFGAFVGAGVGGIIGIIVGQIWSDITVWKRPVREALKFWRME